MLSLLYFGTRLVHIMNFPIFTDEAIYVRWAQIGARDPDWRFISLSDGKQPLFVWGTMIGLQIIKDPLLAGRLVSVLAGFGTLLGIGTASYILFKRKAAFIIGMLLYIFYPFALIHDRMALMDSTVSLFAIWSIVFSCLLVTKNKAIFGVLLGFSIGFGALTKSSGFLFALLSPSAFLLTFKPKTVWFRKSFLTFIYLFGAVVIGFLIYNMLRISPLFFTISQKNSTFIYPLSEWVTHPFQFVGGNLRGMTDWLFVYLTFPVILLILFSFIMIKRQPREKLMLVIWFIIPYVSLALYGKVLYPRFILFMTIPLLILAVWTALYLYERLNKWVFILFFAIILFYPVYVSEKIIFEITKAPIPKHDLGQYVNDWPSGWGIKESARYFEEISNDKPLTVFTEGTFGLLPYGLEIYTKDNSLIKIIGLWPVPEGFTDQMKAEIKKQPTYYIANQFETLPATWSAELIKSYPKGINPNRSLRLYKLFLE
jgi:4-amino-4-deoxy-L-arabinose transferase-like glycosyltransferase